MGRLPRAALHLRRARARRLPARSRERRLHPVLGLQPVGRPARARHEHASPRSSAARSWSSSTRARRASPPRPTTGCGCGPGTDAALALSMTHVMIENGWYDADFVRDWTNADDEVDGQKVWDLLAAQLRGLPAGGRRGDHRRTGRRHRRRRADALGVAAGRVLHVERARAAQRYDADHPRDQRPLRTDREPRRPRRQRAVRRGAGQPDRRRSSSCPATRPSHDRRRRAAARAGAVRVRHRRGPLHRRARPADQGAGRVRRQPGDGARRQRPRPRRPAQPGLLRPGRPVHDAHRRARRHRAAGDDAVRVRGAEDRLRATARRRSRSSSCAARSSHRAARPAPTCRSSSTSPPGSASASTSGTATSTPRGATSSSRAGSPSRSFVPTPRASGCR